MKEKDQNYQYSKTTLLGNGTNVNKIINNHDYEKLNMARVLDQFHRAQNRLVIFGYQGVLIPNDEFTIH